MIAGSPTSESRFFDWIGAEYAPPTKSLDALDGNVITDKPTTLIERIAAARAAPLQSLSCAQVRLLFSQREGLRWLAQPVAAFVRKYPGATTTFYEGDLSLAALKKFAEIVGIAPIEAQEMLKADFSQIAPLLVKDDMAFAAELEHALASARSLIRQH